MKILFATPIYPPEIGGPATYVKEISEKLKRDHEVSILAYADDPVLIDGVELTTISKKQPLPVRLFKYYRSIKRLGKDVDIIHAQNAVASGFPAVLAGTAPVVIRFVGDEAWERATGAGLTKKSLDEWLKAPEMNFKIRLLNIFQRFTLKRADHIMTPSQYLKDVLVNGHGISPDKVTVNYNAAKQPEEYVPDPKVVKKPNQIVATARLVSWKGVDGIISAVALIRKNIPDIHLMVAGDGPELENLKKLSLKLGVGKNVTFLGRVSKKETEALRRQSSLYILNSTHEGLPHTVLTSFYAGIPVIATDIPGTNEVAIPGDTALVVPQRDPQALAHAIESLLGDPLQQKMLVKNGQRLLREKFSWKLHINNLLTISKSLLTKPRN